MCPTGLNGNENSQALLSQCIECNQAITNPVCAQCLAEQMKVMVGEQDDLLAGGIEAFPMDGETQCIICGRKMALCAHCFSKDIYLFLKDKKSPVAHDFLAKFDFELRKDFL